MRFSCPCCRTEYAVPIAKMPRGYYKVVCAHCSYNWRRVVGVETNFPRQRKLPNAGANHGPSSGTVKLVYRPEILAILREEAMVETRLRRS